MQLSSQIIANDASADFTSTATVTININDINDNPPLFKEDVYNADVNEHCEDGTVVTTITVSALSFYLHLVMVSKIVSYTH